MKTLHFLIIIILPILIFGQYDEKAIYFNKARSQEIKRNHQEAIKIYEELLEKMPGDTEIISKIITNLLIINDTDKAEKLLKDNRFNFSEKEILSYSLQILLKKGKISEAKKSAMKYFEKNQGNVQEYREIANIFTNYRVSDVAVELIKIVRTVTKDENLFVMDMARNYEYLADYNNAVIEFLKIVNTNNSYGFYVLSRFKEMSENSEQVVDIIQQHAQSYDNPTIKEILGQILTHQGRINQALEIFATLQPDKLMRIASEQKKTGNYLIAKKSFNLYINNMNDVSKKAEAKIELAEIHLFEAEYDSARTILLEIFSQEELKEQKNRYKTRVNQNCRELLADIALRTGETEEKVKMYLEDAKKYSLNQREQKQIDFKLIKLYLLSDNEELFKTAMKRVLQNEEEGSEIFKLSLYYNFLAALIKEDATADSLMGEILIYMPESDYVNDVFYLSDLVINLKPEEKKIFWSAYKKFYLFKFEEAIELLLHLHELNPQEKFLILTARWAIAANESNLAFSTLSIPYENNFYEAQAKLLMLYHIEMPPEEKRTLITDFLKKHPNNILSPEFRALLNS
ncbi:MAG: hypothetical protein PHR06_08215 [Candidatus Cloacimonetes bacterium]|nr:hypothetical protein [Candidatus Cloacimonadota bacterium]